MRVLLTTDTIGGVWTYTRELTEGLLQTSHSVALVSFGRLPSSDQRAWCTATEARHPDRFQSIASDIPLEWMDANHTAYSGAEALLCDLVARFEPDILHTNQFCFGKLPVSTPILVGAHSDVLSWAAACRPNGLDPSPWLTRYLDLVRGGLAQAAAVVAPTHWMLQALARHFSLSGQSFVIPNGRDVPPGSAPPFRALQAVTVGRLWDEAKGLSLLSDIKSPFPILVAGDTRHETQIAPASLGCAELLGRLDDDALLALFRSSSIYLALSLYEPFGLAPLEAAHCGCAVVARDIPSFREVWGSAALYFTDPPALNSLLKELAADPARLEAARSRSTLRAQLFTRSRMTEAYLELYRHLFARNPLPAAARPLEVTSRVP